MNLHFLYRFVALFLSALLFTQCAVSYGDYNQTEYAVLNTSSLSQESRGIYLFFHGERTPFEYTTLGVVEVEGEKYTTNSKLLNQLKYAAWNNGANAIINIQTGYKDREQGVLFNDERTENYASKYYTGIAVQIQQDSAFWNRYHPETDISFIQEVEEYNLAEANKTAGQVLASVVAWIALIVIVVVKVSQPEESE